MCRRHLALALSFWSLLGCGDADRGTNDAVDTAPGDTAEVADTTVDTAPQDVTPETQDVAPDTTADTADTLDTTDTREVETTPACVDRPVPFPAPTGEGVWNNLASEEVTTLGDPNHRGQDVIVQVGNPQVLVGKFAYAFVDKDMHCEDVDIWIQREVPCGAWEHLGVARTTDNPDDSLDCNNFGTRYGIEDDGGRVFFEIPDDVALPVGRYPIRMVLRGDLSIAAFDLVVVAPGTQAIVTDIDGTLTTSDNELITEVALAIFNETYQQEAYPEAERMVRTWADKGYLVVYATGRPDLLRKMTERWVEPRFPPGPMHLTDTNAQVMPDNEGVGTYKKEFFLYLKSQGLDIVAAYGNATTDIYAYAEAGIPKAITWIIGKHAGEENTNPVTGGYADVVPLVEAMPEATIAAPPAFGWW
jgi:hypothetical protein